MSGEAALARNLVSDSAPADCQVISDLHADANSSDFAIGEPRHVVDISDLLNDQVILIRKLSTVVEVANVITPGEAFLRSSGRYTGPSVLARIHPPRVQGSRSIAPGVQNEADIRCARRLRSRGN